MKTIDTLKIVTLATSILLASVTHGWSMEVPTFNPFYQAGSCLSFEEFNQFLKYVWDVTEILTETLIVVHADVGPVFWGWNETTGAWCHG